MKRMKKRVSQADLKNFFESTCGEVSTRSNLRIISFFDSEGLTPLMHAAKLGHTDVVKSLLESGAPWNALSPSTQSVGDFAMDFGHQEAFEVLLDAGTGKKLAMLGNKERNLIEEDEDDGYLVLHVEIVPGRALSYSLDMFHGND